MRCDFCFFTSDINGVFRKHFRLAMCRTARSILFCCKLCDFVCHSMKDIKSHACSRVRFEFNEMERLRQQETTLKKCQGLMTTVAEIEWYKMDEQLKQVRSIMNRQDLQLSEISLTCMKQLALVPAKIIYSLSQYKKWLTDRHVCLSPLSLESVLAVNKSKYSDRFFVFELHDECDVRHYFKLLFAKAEAAYWPFCVDNQVILHWVFNSTWCPLFRNQHNFYVKHTKNVLSNAVFEMRYSDWYWASMCKEDFFRLIYKEWTSLHFRNIIKLLNSVVDLVNQNWTDLDRETKRVKEKLSLLFPHLHGFINFWNDINCVLDRVERNSLIPPFELIECVELSLTFEEEVNRFVSKKKAKGWQPILQVFRSSN